MFRIKKICVLDKKATRCERMALYIEAGGIKAINLQYTAIYVDYLINGLSRLKFDLLNLTNLVSHPLCLHSVRDKLK